jgi:uncharacterized protein (TIGR03435 family)
MKIRTVLIAGMVMVALGMEAAPSRQAEKLSFEVASIKPNSPGRPGYVTTAPGRVVASSATLKLLVQRAYTAPGGRPLLRTQVIGGPSWVDTDTFDIDAKPERGSSPNAEQLWLMVRTLLEDRFQLKTHRETREFPVYNLVVAKRGKLKLSEDQTPSDPTAPRGTPNPGPARGGFSMIAKASPASLTLALSGNAVRLDAFLDNLLQQYVDRPILNKTGLDGLFDVHLEFEMPTGNRTDSPVASDPGGPNIFTAVQEDLGLKLEPAREPVDVIVIDSVQKPSDN